MQLSDSLQLAAAWFRVLDGEQQARVERDLSVQQAAAGSIIERKGELAQAWIGVLAGLVDVYKRQARDHPAPGAGDRGRHARLPAALAPRGGQRADAG